MKKEKSIRILISLISVVVLLLLFVHSTMAYSITGQIQRNKDMAHRIAEMMRQEGHPEDHPVIVACQEWWKSEDQAETAVVMYTTKEQRAKYPVACAVWQQLKENGLSDVSCAAILGNMMAECGGQTLDLIPYNRIDGFYGLCAWSLYYCPDVDGLSVPGQVDYLLSTLDSNMSVAGGSATEFYSITDVRKAAKYFSDKYERPAVWAEQRATNAEVTYRYFVGSE